MDSPRFKGQEIIKGEFALISGFTAFLRAMFPKVHTILEKLKFIIYSIIKFLKIVKNTY